MNNIAPGFAEEVVNHATTAVNECFNCSQCSGGCQFSQHMDYMPHQIIRLIQLGMKEEALKASGPWMCIGCNRCTVNCPNAIDIPSVMDAIRQMSLREGKNVTGQGALTLHNAMVNSIQRYGRTHKLEVMMRYKLEKLDLFSDMGVGLKMLMKRKLHLTPSKIKKVKEVRKFFKKAS